jgi:hypothetical protein
VPSCPEQSKKSSNPRFPISQKKHKLPDEGVDHLYREIRITNTLTRENGDEVSLKPGAQVEVTVEADAEATTPKKQSNASAAYRGWFSSVPVVRT